MAAGCIKSYMERGILPDNFEITLQAGEIWWWLLPLFLLAVVFWTYRRTWPPVRPAYRRVLLGLRVTVVLLAGILLFDPVLELARPAERRERVAVLVDRSASMLLPYGEGEETRLAHAVSLLESQTGDSLISIFGFGGQLEAVDDPKRLFESPADRTDLSAALEALSRPGSPNWDCVYILSDGVVNAGEDPLRYTDRLPTVEGILIGEPAAAPDVAFSSIRQSRPAFEDEPVELELSVETTSGVMSPGQVLMVDFYEQERKISELRLNTGSAGGRFTGGKAELPAMRQGRHFVRAVLRDAGGEWTLLNNERLIAVDVSLAKQKMLLVSNSPDWDFTFLKRALALERDWAVSSLLIMEGEQGRTVRQQDDEGHFSAADMPGSAALNELRLLGLHGDFTAFPVDFLERLLARAARGNFALVLWPVSGFHTSRVPGGLARFLPFAGSGIALAAQPAPDTPSRFTTSGMYDIIPEFASSTGELPPVERVFLPVPLASGWRVLAEISGQGSGQPGDLRGAPLLAVRQVGGVRAATVLGTGLWHWHMLTRDSDQGGDSRYERFWSMLGAWLIAVEQKNGLSLAPDKGVFSLGQSVTFSGSSPLDSLAPVRLVIYSDSLEADTMAAMEINPDQTSGALAADLGSMPPGLYRFAARRGDGDSAPSVEGLFAVEPFSPEMAHVSPDSSVLRSLANATGGGLRSARDFDGHLQAGLAAEKITHRLQLAGQFWLWFALIALLAVEWTLRRRKSLA